MLKTAWKPFTEIDFSDTSSLRFSIDTRDFHCIALNTPHNKELDLDKTKKNPQRYFHTPQEITELLTRYYNESGGAVDWRLFTLDGIGRKRTKGWSMKYIFIFRFPEGLLIGIDDCFSDKKGSIFIMSKHMLDCDVNKECLNQPLSRYLS